MTADRAARREKSTKGSHKGPATSLQASMFYHFTHYGVNPTGRTVGTDLGVPAGGSPDCHGRTQKTLEINADCRHISSSPPDHAVRDMWCDTLNCGRHRGQNASEDLSALASTRIGHHGSHRGYSGAWPNELRWNMSLEKSVARTKFWFHPLVRLPGTETTPSPVATGFVRTGLPPKCLLPHTPQTLDSPFRAESTFPQYSGSRQLTSTMLLRMWSRLDLGESRRSRRELLSLELLIGSLSNTAGAAKIAFHHKLMSLAAPFFRQA